jgi:hypothetical protein
MGFAIYNGKFVPGELGDRVKNSNLENLCYSDTLEYCGGIEGVPSECTIVRTVG